MKGEIIAIGDELTSGRILNTTSGFAARKLFDAGYTIHAMSTIGDTPELIGEALLQAITRVDFIIVTGGLGSTDDDLTNEAVSQALNRPTIPNLEMLARIRSHLNKQNAAPDNPLDKLAWLPRGAEAFDPKSRTAGYQLIHDDTPIYFLPGVPNEMHHLMSDAVLPRLAAWKVGSRLRTCQRIYKIFGVPETEVNRIINTLDIPDGVMVGYYPVFPDVHLSILIRGKDKAASNNFFQRSCLAIEKALGSSIYGTDLDDLETAIGTLLNRKKMQLAVAESCSGGLLSHRITSVAGSSAYFKGGAVTYCNELKRRFLGVNKNLIKKHGAVSTEVAREMACGIREKTASDIGLSITGIAGPTGGTEDKPVGTVFIAISDKNHCTVEQYRFAGNRHRVQTLTAHTGLNILRLYLLKEECCND